MAKTCPILGKKINVAGGYSNRTRATQYNPTGIRRQKPNLHRKTFFVPEINKSITLELSAKAIKTVNKHGAYAVFKKAGII